MKADKLAALVVVSIVIAVLLATALASFTRVSDSALAEVATPGAGVGAGSSRPSIVGTNYLPIIFLNSTTAGGAWLLAGNSGTNWTADFLGTTDNMTLTFRVSNTVAYRIVPAVDLTWGFSPNIIGGSIANSVSPALSGATIAGGGTASSPNVISGTGSYATIAGGVGNTASGTAATVGGGGYNTVSGSAATMGGGFLNRAIGAYATVPGGDGNTASGDYSLAAGDQAQALHGGAFVWADSTGPTFSSTGSDQFLVRAAGGVGVGTNAPAAQLHISSGGGNSNPPMRISQTTPGEYVRLRLTNDNISVADGYNNRWDIGTLSTSLTIYSGRYGQSAMFITPGGPTEYMLMGNGAHLTFGGAWTNASDKNLKTNFENVDGRDVLAKVSALPMTTWNYKAEPERVRHLGPMAQDFSAAFGLGADDKSITTVDEGGVALAAIKGLAQENKELKARVSALEQGQSPASNALSLNALAPWGVVGLVAVWAMRKKR